MRVRVVIERTRVRHCHHAMLRTIVSALFATALSACAVGVGSPTEPSPDGGSTTTSCDGWADPGTAAACHACSASTTDCQSNGCYGGYWCDTSANKCHATPPPGC